jgi:predicted Zn-dependent peptidase
VKAASLIAIVLALSAGPGAQAPDRSLPPKVAPPPPIALPDIERFTLSNGLPVHVVGRHDVPVARVTLLIFSGATADPAGKAGLASLTAAMLDEGAGGRNTLEIADAVEFLGAALVTSSGFDGSAVRLQVPVARLEPALAVMKDVVQSPDFPANELERLRKERLTSLLQARDDPGAIASTALPKLLFGDSHRYGLPVGGTTTTLRGFTADDLRAFHAAHVRPDNAALVVAGDVSRATVAPLLEAAFGTWMTPGAKPAPGAVPAARPPAKRQLFLVDRPGAAQSEIRIGTVGAARSTPDYFPIEVLNTVFGGSFSSRLNQNLRETHGYAYGAGSRFDLRKAAGPFFAAAAVQTDKTAESLTEFFKELEAIRRPVPDDELTRAKNLLAFGYPSEFETIAALAGKVEEQLLYDLPADVFAQYVGRIQAVTAADVQRVAERYIQPETLLVIVVGDRKAIEAPVRALGLAPVTVLSIDDVMGAAVGP